jgi:hypothetical protein
LCQIRILSSEKAQRYFPSDEKESWSISLLRQMESIFVLSRFILPRSFINLTIRNNEIVPSGSVDKRKHLISNHAVRKIITELIVNSNDELRYNLPNCVIRYQMLPFVNIFCCFDGWLVMVIGCLATL